MLGRSRTAASGVAVLPEPESAPDPQATRPVLATSRIKKAHIEWAFVVTLEMLLEVIRCLHTVNSRLIDVAGVVGEVDAAYGVILVRNIATKETDAVVAIEIAITKS